MIVLLELANVFDGPRQEVEAFADFGVMPELIQALAQLNWGYVTIVSCI